MFCILDIESTGGPYGKESIMEIAMYRYDGSEITDQLISLVHPHREIQKYVSKITGITPKMLLRAPRFHEIAKRIIELTEDVIMVGHNVEFDYRMLRQEFERLGYLFEKKTLDTISLAEKLIPGMPAYGLDTICKELGIFNSQKHRAEGDALATLELFKLLQEKDKEKDISIFGQSVQVNNAIKDKIQDLKRSIKFNKGLYYLHDKAGQLLYLGTSDNIKQEVNKLFIAENETARKLSEETHTLKTEATGNWVVALIKEREELLRAKPRYGKNTPVNLEIGIYPDSRGGKPSYMVKPLMEAGKMQPILKVESTKQAYRAIRMNKRYFKNEQADEILKDLKEMPQEAIYIARGRKHNEKCALIIRDHQLAGYFFYNLNEQISHEDRLLKSITAVDGHPEFTEWLKLGILSGEFRKYSEK